MPLMWSCKISLRRQCNWSLYSKRVLSSIIEWAKQLCYSFSAGENMVSHYCTYNNLLCNAVTLWENILTLRAPTYLNQVTLYAWSHPRSNVENFGPTLYTNVIQMFCVCWEFTFKNWLHKYEIEHRNTTVVDISDPEVKCYLPSRHKTYV